MELPRGTVTFLFTDIEASTELWNARPAWMSTKLAEHDAAIRAAVERCRGVVVKSTGDGIMAVFEEAADAAKAAIAAQCAVRESAGAEECPLGVRMAIHTGGAVFRDNDYVGSNVNRADRLLKIGHGGQVLVSGAAAALMPEEPAEGARLVDLGVHRLRDLPRPERVFQLDHPALPHRFPPLNSLEVVRTNLPHQLTEFVGRQEEIRTGRELLAGARLLTLTGPGGGGKTRLALQVAAHSLDTFPGGVWFADLTHITDPALAARAVASAVGLHEQPGRTVLQTLGGFLASGPSLLVLDNCEHVLDAAAHLAATLLTSCGELKALATSLQALGVPGEQVYLVPTLSLPADPAEAPVGGEAARTDAAAATRSDAMDLFVERARLRVPSFPATMADPKVARKVAHICVRLDGIPLAIELAAAQIDSLSLDQILERLEDRFDLLTGGSDLALPRHQTLRGALGSSHDLLTEPEQIVFRRLAVFVGGCTLEAVEAVCGFGGVRRQEVVHIVRALVGKSMVRFAPAQARYSMLETICAYAMERLEESGETDEVRERHRDYFLALAEETAPKLEKPDVAPLHAMLDREIGNLRAALRWSLLPDVQDDGATRICAALRRFWDVRGYYREGRAWCGEALAHPACQKPDRTRADTLNGAGTLAFNQGDYAAAVSIYEESLAIKRTLGDPSLLSTALNNLGMTATDMGDFERARDLLEQALAIERSLHDEGGEAIILSNLGEMFVQQGRLREARRALEASRSLRERCLGRESLRYVLASLGEIAIRTRRYAEARALLTEGLLLCRQVRDPRVAIEILARLARVAQHTGEPARAAALLGFADSLRGQLGVIPCLREQAALHRVSQALRADLGADTYDVEFARGAAMSLEEGLDFALTVGSGSIAA